MNKLNGFLYGILSSASFGLIPLFAIPAMKHGMDFMPILLYRFSFATLALAIVLAVRGVSFKLTKKDFPPLILLSILYLISSVFLLWGYKFMASGVATTIHFMYPVITTIIMMLFFRERKSLWRMTAITLAVCGVYFLSNTSGQTDISLLGIIIVLISSIGYALYLVTVGQVRNDNLKGLRLTFYVFFFGSIFLITGMGATGNIVAIPDWSTAGNLLLLAIIPTIVSNLALVEAIKNIGSTLTSVLGAMEPVTAVIIGIVVFNETFTFSIGLGIILIITAVTMIILRR